MVAMLIAEFDLVAVELRAKLTSAFTRDPQQELKDDRCPTDTKCFLRVHVMTNSPRQS